MKALIDAAHAKGMKVFFDIITNHTADVIDYEGGQYAYISKAARPYQDASGKAFDDRDYAGTRHLPAAGPRHRSRTRRSSPPRPTRTAKTPAWLNDPTMYHNRGDSTFAGESSDVRRLLRPGRPVHRAARGRRRAWATSTRRGSTSASTASASTPSSTSNMEFWKKFSPDVLGHAKAVGNDDFFMFGEVYDAQPGVHVPVHDRRQAAGHAGLRLPGAARVDFAKGNGHHEAARLLRQRRLVHRHRLQRLRAADLPRQPRHGPRRDVLEGRRAATSS